MDSTRSTRPLSRLRTALVVTISTLGLLLGSAPAQAVEHGADPTEETITAPRGPYEFAQEDVPRSSVEGFGGGTIYYPTTTAEGTFSAVAIAPGFTATKETMAWYGPRLASHGFVVFNIDTITTTDQPDSRAKQLLAALDYLTRTSNVRDRVDPNRLGAMGHSMGGGGSLSAALEDPSLQAILPLTPWHTNKDFSGVRTPTMIISAQNDTVAPNDQHSKPFYASLPDDPGKAYLELAGAGHLAPNSENTTIAKFSIAWLKRFLDDDLRYDKFLCPPPQDPAFSDYQATCPY